MKIDKKVSFLKPITRREHLIVYIQYLVNSFVEKMQMISIKF